MKLTSKEKDDLLLWWSGELDPDREPEVRSWLNDRPEAKAYLSELKELEKSPIVCEEPFHSLDIPTLFSKKHLHDETETILPTAFLDSAKPAPGQAGGLTKKHRNWRSVLFTGLAVAIAFVGLAFFQTNLFWKKTSPTQVVDKTTTSQKIRSLRIKRKRLRWLQTQTRKNRQITFRHRSSTKSRWIQLRKRKPRKGLV